MSVFEQLEQAKRELSQINEEIRPSYKHDRAVPQNKNLNASDHHLSSKRRFSNDSNRHGRQGKDRHTDKKYEDRFQDSKRLRLEKNNEDDVGDGSGDGDNHSKGEATEIISTVIAPVSNKDTVPSSKPSIATDPQSKQRHQRLFGVMLGALKQSQDINDEKLKKRQQILEKVEEKQQKENEVISASLDKLMKQKDEKLRVVRRLENEISYNLQIETLTACHNNYRGFIKTKALPSLYYLPTKLDSKTAELLDESRRNSEQQLQEALAKIENERKLVESRDESSTVDDTESNTNGGYNGDNNNNDNNNNDSDNENYIDTEINLDRIDN